MSTNFFKGRATFTKVTQFLTSKPGNLRQQCIRNYSIQIRCRSALVTGGARGMGYHIAQCLLDNGLQNVLLVDINEKKCKEAADKLNTRYGGPKAFACKCDICNIDDMEILFNRVKIKCFDILINSLSIDDGWNVERTLNTNLRGLVNGTLLGFKYLREGGCIINLSSVHGLEPFYGSPIFCGTQYFCVGFTRSVGTDFFYERTKIKVMGLCPGATSIDSEKEEKRGMPLFRELGDIKSCLPEQEPEEIGKCVLAMLEDGENGSVWVSEDSECYKCHFIDRHCLKRLPLTHC